MTPEQCRAGRALLGWSQDELVAKSGTAKKTVADFERGAQIPFPKTMSDLEAALEVEGVELIPENGGGVGVRLKKASPRLMRKRVSRFEHQARVWMTYRGREFQVRFSTDILEDAKRASYLTEDGLNDALDELMNKILLRAAHKVDIGVAIPEAFIDLETSDFPEAF